MPRMLVPVISGEVNVPVSGPGAGDCHAPGQDRWAISGRLSPAISGLSRSLADTPRCRSDHVTGPDGADFQADSAGSIPVTRSTLKEQVRGLVMSPDHEAWRT